MALISYDDGYSKWSDKELKDSVIQIESDKKKFPKLARAYDSDLRKINNEIRSRGN